MKTLQIDMARFDRLVSKMTEFAEDDLPMIYLEDLYGIIASLQCRTDTCDNECRYDSGYCSLCDMKLNSSNGNRLE